MEEAKKVEELDGAASGLSAVLGLEDLMNKKSHELVMCEFQRDGLAFSNDLLRAKIEALKSLLADCDGILAEAEVTDINAEGMVTEQRMELNLALKLC